MNIYPKSLLILCIAVSALLFAFGSGLRAEITPIQSVKSDAKTKQNLKNQKKLDVILENYREAIGGKKAWDRMDTFKINGTMRSLGTVFKTTVVYKRPDMCRLDIKTKNMNFVESYDGTTPWQLGIAARTKAPTELEGKRAEELKQTCDFDGPLIDYKEKEIELQYEGEEEVEGRAGYKIRVTYKNGSVDVYFIDSETYLPFMVIGETTIKNKSIKSITRMGDFIETGDIKIAYFYEFEIEGVSENEIFKVTSVEINPEIKKGFFSMPRDVKDSY